MTKILLVEDDKSLREIYAVRLVEEGYDIISAGDGEEALAIAIKELPNLVISDVMMPKISGFDMLDILRSTPETKDIRVIMMTALSSEDQRERGNSLGADRYLVKSQVGIEDVVTTVHDVLGDAPTPGQTPLMAQQVSPSPAAPSAIAPAGSTITPGPGPQPGFGAQPVGMPAPQPPVVQTTPQAPAAGSIPQFQTPFAPAAPASAFAQNPAPTPTPVPAPTATPFAAPTPAQVSNALPQPTAPFSTPRIQTTPAANQGIAPLAPAEAPSIPDISKMMEQALAGQPGDNSAAVAPMPAPDQATNPPADSSAV
ncbi:MAG: response regulator [Candidatus Saccharimonas sp.]